MHQLGVGGGVETLTSETKLGWGASMNETKIQTISNEMVLQTISLAVPSLRPLLLFWPPDLMLTHTNKLQ